MLASAAVLTTVIAIGAHQSSRKQLPADKDGASRLRTLLCQDLWMYEVTTGPIAGETCVLKFFEDGKVELTLADDVDSYSERTSWSIKESEGRTILIIGQDQTSMGTRILLHMNYIKYNQNDDTIEVGYPKDGPMEIFKRWK
jgi:hypothetical protein